MEGEKYEKLSQLLPDTIKLCSEIADGAKQLSEGVRNFKEGLKKKPFFVRPFVTRDFESGTGLKADEWIDLAERTSRRFQSIADALQKAQKHLSASEKEKLTEDFVNIKTVAKPFLDNYDLLIETLSRFQKYMAEAPERAKSIPKTFLSEEDRKMMVEESPKAAEGIKKLVKALDEAKTKILEVESLK